MQSPLCRLCLIGACHLIGVEPFAYLRDILAGVPTHPNRQIAELTPRGWRAALLAATT